jgi:hypothetical protein
MDTNNNHGRALLDDAKHFYRNNFVLSLLGFILLGGLLLGHAKESRADDSGNADVAVNGCMEDVAGFGLNCTANDIQIASVTELTILDDGCTSPDDTVTFSAVFEVELTAQARHDIGLWFATDGDPNNDGAISGNCTVATPAYGPDGPWLDLDGTGDTFLKTNIVSNIQDTCGDIDEAHSPMFPTVTITAACIDTDGDGWLNLPNCTSWKQPGDNDLCTSPLPVSNVNATGYNSSGVPPGAPSKCNCDERFQVFIPVPIDLTVLKDNDADGDSAYSDTEVYTGTFPATISYQVTITNNSTIDASITEVNDDIFDITGSDCDLAGATIQAGETITCTFDATFDTADQFYQEGPVTNTISVSAVNEREAEATVSDSSTVSVPDDACLPTHQGYVNCSSYDTDCAAYQCYPAGLVGNCDTVTYFPGKICRQGSGDTCDPDEVCVDGIAACPTDVVTDAGTVCNQGSGDICDPDEVCSGIAGEACPDDAVASSGTVCNPGSGDICDPDEYCTGNPDQACPADSVANADTLCRSGSGNICDPDEYCTGAADTACPADSVADTGTPCGDLTDSVCDNPDTCDGSGNCLQNLEPMTIICRADAGDCDVPEYCDGKGSCPEDSFESGGTACGNGSDTICDNPDTCDGSGTCRPNYESATTTCREDAGECDVAERCDGAGACPKDGFEPEGTNCGNPGDGLCDKQDKCDGSGSCLDKVEPETTLCRAAADECDVDEYCDGAGSCPENAFQPVTTPCEDGNDCTAFTGEAGTPDACNGEGACTNTIPVDEGAPCGDQSITECTDADTCDGEGTCLYNNKPCGSITSSSLCEFSIFRLLFTPDANWISYKLNGSNPGQTFYNIMYDTSSANGDVTLFVTIPYPYVTQGATPLHVYDAETVGSNGSGCLEPRSSISGAGVVITMDDWVEGGDRGGNYNLTCDQVTGPDGAGFCTFELTIPQDQLPDSRLVYANIHLDYGLKGTHLDANPFDGAEDSYDRENHISPWGSCDALVGTATNDGPLALADGQAYWFEHTDNPAGGPLFDDYVQNLNIFKRIVIGTHGNVSCTDPGSDIGLFAGYRLKLVHPVYGAVSANIVDGEGDYVLQYTHKGKPTVYTVDVYDNIGSNPIVTTNVELQGGNDLIQIDFSATNCDSSPLWNSTIHYLKGKNNK